jgi:hypothetical protein
MKKLNKMIRAFFLLSVFLGLNTNSLFANQQGLQTTANNTPIETGMWQGIMDGKPGEGAIFFRLDFLDNGVIEITKQFGGNNITEVQKWEQVENGIQISPSDNSEIQDFDGASILVDNGNTIKYSKGNSSFTLNKWNMVQTGIHWVFMLLLLIVLNELFRHYKWPTLAFYIIIPFVIIPLLYILGYTEVSYWFKWVKLYSVVLACIWFTFMRYTKLGVKTYALFIAAAFLAVNIAEAVIQDFSMGFTPNILNAIAGILSIITLTGWRSIHIEDTKQRDMVWPAMTIFWIVAYDIWNFVFVYLNFPGSAANQFLVLLACTIPALFIKKGTWLQARAFTLAAWFMYYFISPMAVETNLVPLPRNEFLMMAFGILSIAANGVLAFVVFRKKYFQKSI